MADLIGIEYLIPFAAGLTVQLMTTGVMMMLPCDHGHGHGPVPRPETKAITTQDTPHKRPTPSGYSCVQKRSWDANKHEVSVYRNEKPLPTPVVHAWRGRKRVENING